MKSLTTLSEGVIVRQAKKWGYNRGVMPLLALSVRASRQIG